VYKVRKVKFSPEDILATDEYRSFRLRAIQWATSPLSHSRESQSLPPKGFLFLPQAVSAFTPGSHRRTIRDVTEEVERVRIRLFGGRDEFIKRDAPFL